MRLEFESLTCVNFGSFKESVTVRFADLVAGLHYVTGVNEVDVELEANGVGKSTLLNALCWCLYGQLPNGLRNTDLKSWGSDGGTLVEVKLHRDDEDHVITRRTQSSALMLDGKHVEQKDINDFLGMSLSLFKHTVYLAQSQPLFHDLSPREKLDLLTEALGLERWERYADEANRRWKDRSDAFADMAFYLRELDHKHETLTTQLHELIREHSAWKEERSIKFEEFGLEAGVLEIARKKAEDVVETKQKVVKSRSKDLTKAKEELRTLRNTQASVREDIVETRTKLATLTEEARRLLDTRKKWNAKNAVCPTCKQSIPEKDLDKHRRQHNERMQVVADEIEALNKKAEKLVERRDSLVSLVQEAERTFEKRNGDSGTAELVQANANLEAITRDIARNKRDTEVWSKTRSPHEKQLNLVRLRLRALSTEKLITEEVWEDLKVECEKLKFWIKGFKDVRLFILSEVVQELELVTNAMIDSFGLTGWHMSFDIERETQSGTVQRGLVTEVTPSAGQAGVKWQSWSGGESQRLRLIGALALSQVLLGRVGVECDLELLDEPVHFVGESGVEDICAFLAERAREQGRKVILVDHMMLESSLFAGTIRVTKTVEGSKVEVS